MATLKVRKLKSFPTEISVPGDKSISHRAAMFAGMASGTTVIEGFLPSEDCLCSVKAMEAMGAIVEPLEEIDGIGVLAQIKQDRPATEFVVRLRHDGREDTLWTQLLQRHAAGRVTPFSLLVPVVGLWAAYAFLGETPGLLQWLGAAAVLCGLVVNQAGGWLASRWRWGS